MAEGAAGRFRGKTVLVTGAANGIGLSCAERFAAEGAALALVNIDAAAGAAREAEFRSRGAEALFIRCDAGVKSEVVAAVEAAARQFGGLDVLVNNAGINRPADFLQFDEADFDLVIRTNLKSVFLFSQAAARQMVSAGRGGAIVNMTSGNAEITGPTLAAYAASKGGIVSLTKVASLALAPHGIRVNAVGPGTILTDLTRKRLWDDLPTRRNILSRTPLGRFGTGEDVAALTAYLASDDAAYMTGQVVYLDGGRNALNYTVKPAD